MDRLPTLAEAAEAIRAGRLRPLELVDRCLQRIEQADGSLGAWVEVRAEAARRDAEDQQELLVQGRDPGPLQGIPLGIKDIIDIAGWATQAGSRLLAHSIAEQDAAVVTRLKQAGAILLGKTVTTEFAFLDPAGTRNPWNRQHTPGGSSSGSAAAVAAGMCVAALGTQTGGSITRPAAYCGIAGLKPTHGLLDMEGIVPLSPRLDHVGLLARRVEDLRILLAALCDGHPEAQELPRPPRLNLIQEFFLEQADDAVCKATGSALGRLERAGAEIRPLPLPLSFRNLHAMHRLIMAVEAAATHFDAFTEQPDIYSPQIGRLIEEGLATPAVDFSLALRHQELFRGDMARKLGDEGIAVTPSTMTPAPLGLESTGDPAFNSPWSYAGVPTVTIPCGLTAAGLPCGLQLIAPHGREDLLLDVAQWCQGVLDFRQTPPTDAR